MTHDIAMPQLGITMTEGLVLQWLKAAGDQVEKGEPLFIVQTDKVDMEVESPGKGIVTVLVGEQQIVPVGTVIGRVGEAASPSAPPALPAALVPTRRNGPLVSPRARKVAAEFAIDLSGIAGSGEYGRICEADVRTAIARRPRGTDAATSTAAATRRIAERLEQSVATIPQFSLRREVDASRLLALRDELLPRIEARDGVRLSVTDLLLKALAVALRDVPAMNAEWRQDRIEARSSVNVGFAVQGPTRLLVPVVAGADQLTLGQLAQRRAALTLRARDGKLEPGEMGAGSCTLSNLGAYGVDEFRAIVNPPESCILAVGRISPRPFVVDGALAVRPTLRLTLTVDHRVAGGVLGAQFLEGIARAIEQPVQLLA
jgi:pyruvate dehydrogenase E2 component (dihydrolipoamide acetyltransferase)